MEPISKHEQHVRLDGPAGRGLPPSGTVAEQREPRARSSKKPSWDRLAVILGARLRERRAREQEDRFVTDTPARNRVTSTKARRAPLFAVVAVTLSVLASAACGDTGREGASAANAKAGQGANARESAPAAETTASAGSEGGERDKAAARAGEAVARADGGAAARAGGAKAGTGDAGARAGDAEADEGGAATAGNSRGGAGKNTGTNGDPQEITLELTGIPGTGFSGVCSVGGSERALDGQVPGRYVFEPRGNRLECELRKEGGGALGVVFTDGAGVRSEQRTTGGESTVRFVYSNGGVSSSTSTSAVSESQTVTSSDGSPSEGYR